jgi:hypothetical protein
MRTLIVTAVVSFLINFILQFLIDLTLDTNNGNIIVSDPVKIDSINYVQTILISNYQSKTINGLEFYSNKGIIDSVYKEDKIKIIKNGTSKFQISKLYPQTNTTITVFLKNKVDSNYPTITSLNHKEYKFLFNKSSEFEEDVINWLTILINCLSISVVYTLFIHFADVNNKKHIAKANERLDEREEIYKAKDEILESRSKEFEAQMVTTRNEIKDIKDEIQQKIDETRRLENSWAKIKLLLIRQVRDLKKENEFYKSLLSNVVEKSNGKIEMNRLEELIKDVLQTHSARINIEKDAKLIDAIANILSVKKSE